MKKLLLSAACVALLSACGSDKKGEYDRYYEQSYRDSVEAAMENAPPTAQTKTGADATTGAAATAPGTTTDAAAPAPAKNEYALGVKLIVGSDCLACHKDDQKVVGPAYVDVAAKYEFNDKNVDYLAEKIIKGGVGVWGQVPMPAHPDLSKKDAQEMARYVLSLKK